MWRCEEQDVRYFLDILDPRRSYGPLLDLSTDDSHKRFGSWRLKLLWRLYFDGSRLGTMNGLLGRESPLEVLHSVDAAAV